MKVKFILGRITLGATMVAALSLVSNQSFSHNQNDMDFQMTMNQDGVVKSKPTGRFETSGRLVLDVPFAEKHPLLVGANAMGNSTDVQHSGDYNDVEISAAKLFFDSTFNDLTRGHLSLRALMDRALDEVALEEALVSFADAKRAPYYAVLGLQYLPFGHYDHDPIAKTFTQTLSEIRRPGVVVGYLNHDGLSAALYGLQGSTLDNAAQGTVTRINNFGGRISYHSSYREVDYCVWADYIMNMGDMDYIHDILIRGANRLEHDVPAWNFHLIANRGQYDVGLFYFAAGEGFSQSDLTHFEAGRLDGGARPRAGVLAGGYRFLTRGHDSRVGLSYQRAEDTKDIRGTVVNTGERFLVPEERYSADYRINMLKNTDLGFEVRHDKDYPRSEDGMGSGVWVGVVRLALQFA